MTHISGTLLLLRLVVLALLAAAFAATHRPRCVDGIHVVLTLLLELLLPVVVLLVVPQTIAEQLRCQLCRRCVLCSCAAADLLLLWRSVLSCACGYVLVTQWNTLLGRQGRATAVWVCKLAVQG
jgi:hypothetical protein